MILRMFPALSVEMCLTEFLQIFVLLSGLLEKQDRIKSMMMINRQYGGAT